MRRGIGHADAHLDTFGNRRSVLATLNTAFGIQRPLGATALTMLDSATSLPDL